MIPNVASTPVLPHPWVFDKMIDRDEAGWHADELHMYSRPHKDVSGKTPEEVAASHAEGSEKKSE